MGTIYYGICHDCKQYIDLDKFGDLNDMPRPGDDYSDYKTDNWLFKALRLHAFIHMHNGHRIGVYSETDFDFLTDDGDNPFKEQAPWPTKEFLDMNEKINNSGFSIYVSNIVRRLYIFLTDKIKKQVSVSYGICNICGYYKDLRYGACIDCCKHVATNGKEVWDIRNPGKTWKATYFNPPYEHKIVPVLKK